MDTLIREAYNSNSILKIFVFVLMFTVTPVLCSSDKIEIYYGTDCSNKTIQTIQVSQNESRVIETKIGNTCKQYHIRSNQTISNNHEWKFDVDTSYGLVYIGPIFDIVNKKYLKSIIKRSDYDAKILWHNNDTLIYGIDKTILLINLKTDRIIKEVKYDSYVADISEYEGGFNVLLSNSIIGKWPWQLLLALAGHPALYTEFEILEVNTKFETIRKSKIDGKYRDGQAIFIEK